MGKINLLELRSYREMWNDVNVDALPDGIREIYLQRKKAVDLYIDGIPPQKVSIETGIISSEIIRLVRKCTVTYEHQKTIGYAALIPYKQNVKTVSKLQKLFLQYPTIENFVLGNYFNNKKYTIEHNMNIKTLHSKFVNECRRLGIQDYEYPFTLKDNGYDALIDYINKAKLKEQNNAILREDENARQRFNATGYGQTNNMQVLNPYGVVQIDGHKIDLLYSIEVENEHGEIVRMPAMRAWLIAVIDIATRAIIGYSVSPYENYNQSDVLAAIYNSIIPHEKIKFTHECFSYPDNGGFPSLTFPELQWATFDMIMLDNAKAHLAKNTLDKLTNNIKCAVNFGSVATPETRGLIERFFKTLELGGFHRLPGTTGSNSKDTKKNNPENESIKYGISFEDICELLEYLIAEYNNSAHSSLENQSPLQVMERRIRQAGMYPYITPLSERQSINKLTFFVVERTVRGNYSTGSRPHISYLGTQYHAHDKIIPMDMVNKKAIIEVNPDDVSNVNLYDNNGIFIANLVATGEWGRTPHSLRTHRAALNRANKNKENNKSFSPNLTLYENELRENSKSNRKDRTKISIIEREKEKKIAPNNTKLPKNINKNNKSNDSSAYSKEEIDLIDSLSIEEAYRRGLL